MVPLDEYLRIVLGVKLQARRLEASEDLAIRTIGNAISRDMSVLIRDLRENDHTEGVDLPVL